MESTEIGAQRIMKPQYFCILHILICTYLEYIYLHVAGVRVRFVTSLNLLEMTDKDFRGRGGLNRLITS